MKIFSEEVIHAISVGDHLRIGCLGPISGIIGD